IFSRQKGAFIVDLFCRSVKAGDDIAGFNALAGAHEDLGQFTAGRGRHGNRPDRRALANCRERIVDGGDLDRAGHDIGGAAGKAAGATATRPASARRTTSTRRSTLWTTRSALSARTLSRGALIGRNAR